MSISESRLRGIIREEAARLLEQAGPEVGTTGAAGAAVSTGPRKYVFSVELQADATIDPAGLDSAVNSFVSALMAQQMKRKPVKISYSARTATLKPVR